MESNRSVAFEDIGTVNHPPAPIIPKEQKTAMIISIIGFFIALLGGCIADFTTSIIVIAVGLALAVPGAIRCARREAHAEY